jgi:uncharacterized DUF497 family protein
MGLTFEWDEAKAKANVRKHRITFEEARTVFYDPLSITIPDPQHSGHEARFVDVGCSSRGKVLVVVYTERGGHIRMISCRSATRSERKVYEENSL